MSPTPPQSPVESAQNPQPQPPGGGQVSLLSFVIGVLLASVVWGGALFALRRPDPPPITLQPPPTPAPTATAAPSPTPAPITVYVTGAVARPGLYPLPYGARVGDALSAAGGANQDAAAEMLNQAELLYDGAQVHVPSSITTTTDLPVAPVAGVSGSGVTATRSDTIILPSSSPGGRINVNTASAEELDALPGIGLSRAEAIIANRPYATVDDLDRVPGIGERMIEQLRDLVTVQ